MEGPALLDALVALAEEAGITVRVLPGSREGDLPARSGACRMRGAPWLLLAPGDAVEDRIAAAVDALRGFAPDLTERRFVPPAVRQRLRPGDA